MKNVKPSLTVPVTATRAGLEDLVEEVIEEETVVNPEIAYPAQQAAQATTEEQLSVKEGASEVWDPVKLVLSTAGWTYSGEYSEFSEPRDLQLQ
jgi:hypothetical protein